DRYRNGRKLDTILLNPGKNEDAVEIELVSNDPLPEEEVIKRERYRKLQACIASLKPEYKTVIILRDIQNYSYEEIAEILQVPLGTVKSHISRARAALCDALREMLE
ncbi:MAG: sigma-70 family RNA polymerase sigma factor, partial [Caldicoprobacter sp.]|uniref:sigma-70 family RNA polymerase sigma factor n=1 Tax=Caldicoprobacter sp. TaxID=2004500 RepID=UPI0039C09574